MSAISEKVLPVIRATRELSLPFWGKVEVKAEKGNPHSLVTQVDQDVEHYLRKEIAKFDDGVFVGEEFGGDRSAQRLWLCDPIDGTEHLIRGLPFCTTMLALVEDGQVVFSAIYDFVQDVMYWAARGEGAFRESERIHVSERDVPYSFLAWETRLHKEENNQRLLRLRGVTRLIGIQCAGYEFALVASGKIEGRVNFDPWGNDYDYAPGSLLVSEAGGIVRNLGSETYDYKNTDMIAATPAMYAALTAGEGALFPQG